TPCVFVVHIRPQPVNDTRVVRSPARTLDQRSTGRFSHRFPPRFSTDFHRKEIFLWVCRSRFSTPSQDRAAASIASFSRRWSHRERPGSFVPAPLSFHLHSLVGT